MAKEAIQKITEVEAKGKALKAEAMQKAANTEAKAAHDGAGLIAEKIAEAKAEAARLAADTEAKCSAILAEAKENAAKKGENMKNIIAANEASVINGIIELLA